MMHVPLKFPSEWCEFPSAPYLAGKKNFMTARVSMLLKSRASPDMLPFSLCNKKRLAIRHMNRPLFPTTLSIPSYDNGKYVGLRTNQHPLILKCYNTWISFQNISFLFLIQTMLSPLHVLSFECVLLVSDSDEFEKKT